MFGHVGVIGSWGKMDKIIELIFLARAGDDTAFSELCEQYKNLMDSMSRKYSGACSVEYASFDDFYQEARMAFYNAIVKYDTDCQNVTFGAFAKVCVRNRLVSYVRKLKSKKRHKGESDVGAAECSSLQDTVVRRELGEKLISVADSSLSKYEKRIFSYYLDGMRVREISSLVGKGEKSVNNAIYRIRSKLKKTVL